MPDPQPCAVERAGIRTERRRPAAGGTWAGPAETTPPSDRIDIHATATGARVTIDLGQAHELIDQLAYLLHRPDLIERHRHQPQPRTQPGTFPQPRRA